MQLITFLILFAVPPHVILINTMISRSSPDDVKFQYGRMCLWTAFHAMRLELASESTAALLDIAEIQGVVTY